MIMSILNGASKKFIFKSFFAGLYNLQNDRKIRSNKCINQNSLDGLYFSIPFNLLEDKRNTLHHIFNSSSPTLECRIIYFLYFLCSLQYLFSMSIFFSMNTSTRIFFYASSGSTSLGINWYILLDYLVKYKIIPNISYKVNLCIFQRVSLKLTASKILFYDICICVFNASIHNTYINAYLFIHLKLDLITL